MLITTALIAADNEAAEKLYYTDRNEIPAKFTWDLTIIFESEEKFEEAYTAFEEKLPTISEYKGRLSESPKVLAEAIELDFQLYEDYYELQVYSFQYRDLNLRNAEATDMFLRVSSLASKLDQAVAYIEPEITQIPVDVLQKWAKKKVLKPYKHYLENLIRMNPHVCSAEVEEVLAAAGQLANTPQQVWANLVSADIEWPSIKDANGEDTKVIPSLYYSFVANQDRRIRKEAALALFGTYTDYANTFATSLNGSIQKDILFSQTRNYDNTLEMVVNEINVPVAVIDNLVETVHANLDMVHRYAALRKKVLGIDEFHVYDLYVPMVAEAQKHFTYEEATELALDFWLKTYGQEYHDIAERAFNERWVDVYVSEGKRGGAYSWGTYNSVPYLLLNWGGTLEDVFTLVHEMGHSVHTYMSNKYQPFQYADYSLFVAEVASVTSEALLLEYMLDRTDDPTERLDLLNLYLNNITGTFLRQVFFHEVEDKAHKMAESGESVTKESLGNMYGELWQEYYGPELVLDEEFKAGWARVSHFYRTYYVWVYASSFAAGEAIANKFRMGDEEGAVKGYLDFMKLGGSVYPMDALKTAGVDMNDPTVIQTVMKRYDETLTEMEKLFAERMGE